MEKNYVVYQHVTPDGMYYFGQSQNVERRWRNNGAGYKETSLQPYIEKFGWENIQHIVLFRDKTKEDAIWIEGFLIETAREDGVCINKNRSGNISKEEGYQREYQREYKEKNREKILEQNREYREQNREKILEHYEKNREKILEQQREYREQNREKILERKRKCYQKNREKYREYQREYQRQYRRRKKEEKQHKEVETTPLF